MRNVTIFTATILFSLFSFACSQDKVMDELVSATRTDNDLGFDIGPSDLELDLDISPDFLLRNEELKLELTTQVQPDVEGMIAIGKGDLAKYSIDPAQISTDPNDPKFAVLAQVVRQLEYIYSKGYAVKLVDGLLWMTARKPL